MILSTNNNYLNIFNCMILFIVYYILGIMYDALTELADLSLLLQDRCLSLSEANSCIDRTIRIFDSMAENYGPKLKEVNDTFAKADAVFKNVKLATNKSIPKIIPSQFFRSLANNLRSRLFTTQASRHHMCHQ